MKKMKLSDIKINKVFRETIPSKKKMDECRLYWDKYHKQDRYIVVNHDGELIDGYIQYLVLKENNEEEAEIKISNSRKKRWHRMSVHEHDGVKYRNEMTTYIYGIHPNSKSIKERVWRVPYNWKGWENDILPGDKILVCTKRGIALIIVTKIEWLDKCPVDMPVRKVYRKLD